MGGKDVLVVILSYMNSAWKFVQMLCILEHKGLSCKSNEILLHSIEAEYLVVLCYWDETNQKENWTSKNFLKKKKKNTNTNTKKQNKTKIIFQ